MNINSTTIRFNNYNLSNNTQFKKDECNTLPRACTSNELYNQLEKQAMFGMSNVSFNGKFSSLNRSDNNFILKLVTLLGLGNEFVQRFQNTLSEFLNKNNCKSIEDLSGDENKYERFHLADELAETAGIDIDDDKVEIINDAIQERCNDANYTPSIVMLSTNPADKLYIDTIGEVFKFDNSEKEVFASILLEEMDKFGVDSLSDLKVLNFDEYLDLSGKLERIFRSFTSIDISIIIDELKDRITQGDEYKSNITSLDRDPVRRYEETMVYSSIIAKFDNITQESMGALLDAMRKDAAANEYDNIFDLFKESDSVENYPETKAVLETKPFENCKYDLPLYFYSEAQDIERKFMEIRLDDEFKHNNYFLSCEYACRIDDLLNLPYQEFEQLQKELQKQELVIMFDDDAIKTVVNKIISKLNLPTEKSQLIFDVIKNTNTEGCFPFEYLERLADKNESIQD